MPQKLSASDGLISETSIKLREQDGAQVASKPMSTNAIVADAILRALAMMARVSHRHQAEVDAALHRADLTMDVETLKSALRQLAQDGCLSGWIPLSDGGLVVTVTAAGMSRACNLSIDLLITHIVARRVRRRS